MFSPWKRMSPAEGVSRRLMHRGRVDLPEPEAPMREVTSPGRTVKSISFSTWWLPKDLDRCLTCKMASLILPLSSRAAVAVPLFLAVLVKGRATVGVAVGPGGHGQGIHLH